MVYIPTIDSRVSPTQVNVCSRKPFFCSLIINKRYISRYEGKPSQIRMPMPLTTIAVIMIKGAKPIRASTDSFARPIPTT